MSEEPPTNRHQERDLPEHALTGTIIECFYRVYDGLSFGLFEAVYRNALAFELREEGLDVLVEAPVEVFYKGFRVGFYRLDLLVERRIVVEVKAVEVLASTAKRQTLNYLRATGLDVGLLLHFASEAKFHRLVSPRLITKKG